MARKARSIVLALIVSTIGIAGCGKDPVPPLTKVAQTTDRQILNVYNWPDYISEDTIRRFEAASGIKVNYTTYSNNDALERQLASALALAAGTKPGEEQEEDEDGEAHQVESKCSETALATALLRVWTCSLE